MRKILRILLSFVLIATMCFGPLAACQKEDETYVDDEGNVQKKVLLNFFGWGGIEEQRIFKTLIDAFNEEYEQYKVAYNAVTSDSYITTLTNYKNNPRNMPDVFYMPDQNAVQWLNDTDIMLNLSPYIEKSEVFKESNVWNEGFDAYRFDKTNKKLGTGDIYAFPKDVGPTVLAYNKAIIAEKGLTVISDPAKPGYNPATKEVNKDVAMTWAQFVKFCQAVNTGLPSSSTSKVGVTHYPLEMALAAVGGEFHDASRKTAQFDNDKFAEALQFVADLSRKYQVMPTSEGQVSQSGMQRFSSGLAASTFIGAWNTPDLWHADFDWDILLPPVPNQSGNLPDAAVSTDLTGVSETAREGLKPTTVLGSVGIAVYNKSKNIDAAYKLAEFITVSEQAQRINYKQGMSIPNLIDMAEGEFLTEQLDDPTRQNRPQNRQAYLTVTYDAGRRPYSYTYGDEWWKELWTSATDAYKLSRVMSNSNNYGGPVDVWNWSSKARINNGFLSGLQTETQKILDKYKNNYSW